MDDHPITTPRHAPSLLQLVYAVLGVYINLVAFALIRNNAATEKAMIKQPEPTAPDYTTRACRGRAGRCRDWVPPLD